MRQAYNVGNFGIVPSFGGASREFDGVNDKIDLPSGYLELQGDDAVSFSVWIWLTNKDHNGEGYIGNWDGAQGWFLQMSNQNAEFNIASSWENGHLRAVSDSLSPNYENWAHIAITYDGSESENGFNFYINGTPATSLRVKFGGAPSTISYTLDPIIGYRITAFHYTGKLADFRYYTKELSNADVATIYGGSHVPDGLSGWWLTDADDVLDYSGSGNHGTNDGSVFSTDGPLD